MKMFSKDGLEMMDLKSFQLDGDNLVMKGKMMGSMNMAVYLKPEDMSQVLSLMPWSVIVRLPMIFLKGLLRQRRKSASATS
ncbi:hypothetical protein [Pseudomonas sp. NBRC 100443]|uniref:hypothetical protein n=1 Tax=Pseudomonas sp. NBRC 100443 TaxID=1113665 RepID=UPI0024A405BA|nr:hypothetical protein [Pseudomonas sp. NBRC 100443]GLU37311.1 hypothetical protein Pssp01_14040 [Pseudomonas sp. NBRC 100443]